MQKRKNIDPEIERVVFDDLYVKSTLWALLLAVIFAVVAVGMKWVIEDVIYPSLETKQVSEWRLD